MTDPAPRGRDKGRRPAQARAGHRPFVSGGVPLYYQLATLLRERIVTGHYQKGEQLPPQLTLAKDYGVSRLTAREALKQLEGEGLIRQEQGRGTFVTYEHTFTGDMALDGSIDDLITMGLATRVRLLDRRQKPATPELATALGLEVGELVLHCQRLRLFRGEPYCHIHNTLPLDIGRRIEAHRWEEGSVLQYIEDELGLPLREAEQQITAALADANLARWLDVRIGAPLLRVDYLIRTENGRAVEQARLYYRGDRYRFTIDLTRDPEKSRPSPWSLRPRPARG